MQEDNGPTPFVAYASIFSERCSPRNLSAAEKLGTDLAAKMLGEGAEEILTATKKQMAEEIAKEKAAREAKKAAEAKQSWSRFGFSSEISMRWHLINLIVYLYLQI